MGKGPPQAQVTSPLFPERIVSSQVAFVWDHDAKCITWMSLAARKKFDSVGAVLTKTIAARLKRRLDDVLRRKGFPPAGQIKMKIALANGERLNVYAEPLNVAGGHKGFVVREIDSSETECRQAKSACSGSPADENVGKPWNGKLSNEDLRAFKAVGREVRKLCRRKPDAKRSPLFPQVRPIADDASPGGQLPLRALKEMLSAFDIVLLLDEDFCVLNANGQLHRLGWRKKAIVGKPVASLFPLRGQAVIARTARKLVSGPAAVCRDALLAADGTPYRIALGRWPEGDAACFFTLLSLQVPRRLKRHQSQTFSTTEAQPMAA